MNRHAHRTRAAWLAPIALLALAACADGKVEGNVATDLGAAAGAGAAAEDGSNLLEDAGEVIFDGTTVPPTTAEPTTTEAPTTVAPTTEAPTTTEAATTTTTPRPKPRDFRIELVVLEDHCFDSAGANVTVEPDLYTDYDGAATVIYEVHGGEHVETFSIELDGTGSFTYDQDLISTPSCDHNLTAKVVRVIER